MLGVSIDDPKPIRLDHILDHPASVGFPPEPPADANIPRRPGSHPRRGIRQPVPDREGDRTAVQRRRRGAGAGARRGGGIAIDNARLYEQSQARQAWIEATRDIATELLSGTDPATVFRLIADETLTLTDARGCTWWRFLSTTTCRRRGRPNWWSPRDGRRGYAPSRRQHRRYR